MRDFQAMLAETERSLASSFGLTVEQYRVKTEAEHAAREAERQAEEERRERSRRARHRAEWIAHYSTLVEAHVAEAVYDRREGPSEATSLVGPWLASDMPCLVLSGGVGAGKSVAALVALREHIGTADVPRAKSVRYVIEGSEHWVKPTPCPIVRAAKLATAIDPWKHERDEGATPMPVTGKFLCIDDLGAELEEPRFHQALFTAIDARQSPTTRTIITTNLRRDEIRPRYGDRIADRLNAIAKVVQLRGTSMRKQGAGL